MSYTDLPKSDSSSSTTQEDLYRDIACLHLVPTSFCHATVEDAKVLFTSSYVSIYMVVYMQ